MSIITEQELGDYLGRSVSGDAGATLAVEAASQIVQTITEQDFGTVGTATVSLDGSGSDVLFLPQRPVGTIGTVSVNGEDVTDFTYTTEGWLVRTSEDTPTYSTWAPTYQPSAYWPEGRQNVTVTYTHGYAGTVPDDVRMVAISIAHRMVTQGGATSEQVGDVRKTYAVSSTDLTAGEMAILSKYRR